MLQGMVRAAGTLSEVKESGFNFGLEAVEDVRHTVNEKHGQSPDHHDCQGSTNRWKRQNSGSSQVRQGASASITVTMQLNINNLRLGSHSSTHWHSHLMLDTMI
jgi:hypothetical protein